MKEKVEYKSKVSLYCFTNSKGTKYFNSNEKLGQYLKSNNLSLGYITKLEYMGNILNCIDVIRQTYQDGSYRYISVADEDGYVFYNEEISRKENQIVWEYLSGSLREIYDAFKENGVVLEDDTYKKIDERNHSKVKKHLLIKSS